ncbi:MAG: holo-ACP synthase [Alphaproteobacteria bacterium]|nr:holo-ACP synthase [Alphaproteobacteria bacterium]
MIIGIGTDLVKISRIEDLYKKFSVKLLERILSNIEQSKFREMNDIKGIRYLAKRFAAKEAFVKSLGTGFNDKVSMNDISIDNDDKGKPYYDINKKLDQYIQNTLNVTKYSINLSITDDREYANAIAIIERVT